MSKFPAFAGLVFAFVWVLAVPDAADATNAPATNLPAGLAPATNTPPTNTPAAGAPSSPVTNAAITPAPPPGPSLYNFTVNSLDGKPVDLGQYRGHVALVVNTATHCGFAYQLAALQKLYDAYKDKGLVVLAFPSNDFGHQEPDSADDIAKFCSTRFNITFPIFEKTKTRGEGQSPVYQFLTTGRRAPNWNFHKYLVDKNGQVIREFPSQLSPDDKSVHDAIEAALKS